MTDPAREAFVVTASEVDPSPRAMTTHAREVACDTCGAAADTVHLLPWVTNVEQIEAACPAHDPGGYWFPLDDLRTEPMDWLLQLAGKVVDPGHVHAVVVLLRWLGGPLRRWHVPPLTP